VEYGDYECPYCGMAYPIVASMQQALGDDLRFVFRNFPLTQAHPLAHMAAELAEAAAAQDKFWPMHDALFNSQDSWAGVSDPAPALDQVASSVGADMNALKACVSSHKMLPLIEAARADLKGEKEGGRDGYWDDWCLVHFLEGMVLRYLAYPDPQAQEDPEEVLKLPVEGAAQRGMAAFETVFANGTKIQLDHFLVYFSRVLFSFCFVFCAAGAYRTCQISSMEDCWRVMGRRRARKSSSSSCIVGNISR